MKMKMEMITITVQVSKALHKRIEKLRIKLGESTKGTVIRQILSSFLDEKIDL